VNSAIRDSYIKDLDRKKKPVLGGYSLWYRERNKINDWLIDTSGPRFYDKIIFSKTRRK
jgi:hypothetical protein